MSIMIDDSHSDDSAISDTNDNEVMSSLTHSLFSDHPSLQMKKYAITLNIQPTRYMNKRQWAKYTHEQQKGILTRVEGALRRNNPSIVQEKIMFEVCPALNQIHFHALYSMPAIYKVELEAYFQRVCGSIVTKKTDLTKEQWRHLNVQEVYDEQGWIKYISKDANKN